MTDNREVIILLDEMIVGGQWASLFYEYMGNRDCFDRWTYLSTSLENVVHAEYLYRKMRVKLVFSTDQDAVNFTLRYHV